MEVFFAPNSFSAVKRNSKNARKSLPFRKKARPYIASFPKLCYIYAKGAKASVHHIETFVRDNHA